MDKYQLLFLRILSTLTFIFSQWSQFGLLHLNYKSLLPFPCLSPWHPIKCYSGADTGPACGGWDADASSEGFAVVYVVIYSFHQVSLKGHRFTHIHIYLCLSSHHPHLYFFSFFFCLSISLLFCCSCSLTEWHHFIGLDVCSDKGKRKWISVNFGFAENCNGHWPRKSCCKVSKEAKTFKFHCLQCTSASCSFHQEKHG